MNKSKKAPVILVVDDEPSVLETFELILGQRFNIVTAASGQEALDMISKESIHLIFLDINLPHMDGYQLCKIIKNYGLTKDVPVVMLSGKDGFFDKMKGRMAGAKDYITKPFEPDVIIEAADKYIKLWKL